MPLQAFATSTLRNSFERRALTKNVRFITLPRKFILLRYYHFSNFQVTGDNKSKDRAEQELGKLRDDIAKKEKELDKIKPQYEEMKKREDECTRELALKEQKRKELYAKQGRGSQFTSKDQRDEWIKKELKSLNKQIKVRFIC